MHDYSEMDMSLNHPLRGQPVNHQQKPSLPEKPLDGPVTSKTAQSTVTCIYQTHIAGFWRTVTVLWCKNLMNHGLTLTIEGLEGGDSRHYTCKIDLKPWHFWSKKGLKSMEVDGTPMDVYWDLRSAKFSTSPEPCSDYYVALVCHEEVVLLVGDLKKKAYKRSKSRPALTDALLIYKKENVFAKKSFPTRAKLDERSKEHDIVVESSAWGGSKDPEMWISIDGIVVIHVKNLQWKFRGNETVLVSKQPVQVFWDVHDWLFHSPGTGHGLFIFKPGAPELSLSATASESSDKESCNGDGDDDSCGSNRYYSTRNYSTAPEYCLFLYAWKIE